jgi:hypothetical protein
MTPLLSSQLQILPFLRLHSSSLKVITFIPDFQKVISCRLLRTQPLVQSRHCLRHTEATMPTSVCYHPLHLLPTHSWPHKQQSTATMAFRHHERSHRIMGCTSFLPSCLWVPTMKASNCHSAHSSKPFEPWEGLSFPTAIPPSRECSERPPSTSHLTAGSTVSDAWHYVIERPCFREGFVSYLPENL